MPRGWGAVVGRRRGRGDDLGPRQVGGGGMVVRVVYTIALIDSREEVEIIYLFDLFQESLSSEA
jgi:hypothetical protein